MKILKCIAIDDEPLALSLIETFVKQTPFLELVNKCDNGIEAIDLLQKEQVDLIFLDINMPQFSGMELAKWLKNQGTFFPKIIFTTAYNHYAIEGYKVDAVDYLLKPFGYEEFLQAATKSLQLIEQQNQQSPEADSETSMFVKVEYQWVRIHFDDILYIEGLKDYVQIHLKSQKKTILTLMSLKQLQERLPSALFMRIHRSFIVSLKKIDSITKTSVIVNGREIGIGEQYKEDFKSIIVKWMV